MSAQTKLLSWSDDASAALAEWIRLGTRLGIDLTSGQKGHGVNASAAVRAALRRATACRCGDGHGTNSDVGPRGHDGGARANPLRSIRLARGLSQSQAAEHLGVTRSTVATMERNPTATTATVARWRHVLA